MSSKNDRVSILEVNIKKDGDVYEYENIFFSPNYHWTESDKKKVEEVIKSCYNSFSLSGEEAISTSFGEVIVTHEKHPSVPRMKLILGFLKDPSLTFINSTSLVAAGKVSSLLKEFSPALIKDNPQAIQYLSDLDREVQLDEHRIDKLKFEIFNAILESLEKNSQSYTNDEASSQRLPRLIANIKTFYLKQTRDDYSGG